MRLLSHVAFLLLIATAYGANPSLRRAFSSPDDSFIVQFSRALLFKDWSEITRLLELPGINVNEQGLEGRTALHVLAHYNRYALVGVLVSKGADVNACDVHGLTPLHLAAKMCNGYMCQELMKYKANIHAKSNYGQTPRSLMCKRTPVRLLLIAAATMSLDQRVQWLKRDTWPQLLLKDGWVKKPDMREFQTTDYDAMI